MSAAHESSRLELQAEVNRLRAEVDRLHDLMGLASRTGEEHRQSWAPTLFNGSAPTSEVTQPSKPAAKIDLIRSLFGARSDVYAQRWENPNTNKSEVQLRRLAAGGRSTGCRGFSTSVSPVL